MILISLISSCSCHYLQLIHNGLVDVRNVKNSPLFSSLHTLFMLLYTRNSRRRYVPNTHWLIKEVRVSSFMADFGRGKKSTQVKDKLGLIVLCLACVLFIFVQSSLMIWHIMKSPFMIVYMDCFRKYVFFINTCFRRFRNDFWIFISFLT